MNKAVLGLLIAAVMAIVCGVDGFSTAKCQVRCVNNTYKTVLCSQTCKATPQVCTAGSSSGGTVQCGSGTVQSCSPSACVPTPTTGPTCKTSCSLSDCGRVSNNCGGHLSCGPCILPCNFCQGSRRSCRRNSDCPSGQCNFC